MKTLNRPMFRYGGPIKEGVMHGIREPRRDGGSMTQRVQPSNDGSRPGYAGPASPFILAGMGIARAAPYVARGARAGLAGLKRIFGKTTNKPAPFSPVRTQTTGGYSEYGPASYTKKFIKDTATKSGGVRGAENVGKLGGTEVFTPNFIGRDPLVRLGGKIISGVTNPAVTGKLASAARFVISPSGAIIGGLYYANGKFFNKNNEEVNPPKGDIKLGGKVGTSGAPGGGDPNMTYTAPEKELTLAEREKIEADNRIKQMDRYKEIMDIKGMSKDATYKSLIDASNIIREGGNLKEGIKDGSLISKLTTAASKRFDKVSDTETALRSLIAKGEIDKEMNKEKNALDNKKTNLQIKAAEKTLTGASLAETANAVYERTGKFPKGNDLANVARTKGIEVVGIEDSTAVENWIGENGGDEITYMQDIIARGIDVAPGPHVLRSRIILVDSEGNVSPYF